ncbi:ead/Ea22-like family protein [Citrobacter amalonaticus]|uniref:ead/Ea22-like family protein n=1 Tax=Citrobacter amalonaticus TaxID=35703 RepID=UPI001C9397A8|nr:ead/Ea22-like family protein [Citrobacter amalonaticus]MBY5256980.1 ead/Ea22-like family protein [Citrobacter amalonaticus]
MSNIDKRALREAAEKALPAMQRLLMMPNDELFDEALLNVDGDVDAANAFNLLTGPETVLALLDELEAKDKAWAAQDDHINQQADRIESLEKKNGDLGKALGAAEKRIAELEARAFNPAILDVIAERQRQQSVEGWTTEHDDQYEDGELIDAAACYAKDSSLWDCIGEPPSDWPWNDEWWKPSKSMRRNLIKAGALILAEIERRDRAAGIGKGE